MGKAVKDFRAYVPQLDGSEICKLGNLAQFECGETWGEDQQDLVVIGEVLIQNGPKFKYKCPRIILCGYHPKGCPSFKGFEPIFAGKIC